VKEDVDKSNAGVEAPDVVVDIEVVLVVASDVDVAFASLDEGVKFSDEEDSVRSVDVGEEDMREVASSAADDTAASKEVEADVEEDED